MADIISNAYNFSDYISTGVDPRTGMFSASINLGNFIPYFGSGTTIPLSLQYSPSNMIDVGFGNGWHLPLTRFSKETNLLSLSSGQSFIIEWDPIKKEYFMPYRKIKDIRVLYDRTNPLGHLIVQYKSGVQEFIDFDTGHLKTTLSPTGLKTLFNYRLHDGHQVLYQIKDEYNTRVIFIDSWTDRSITTLRHFSNPQGSTSKAFQTIIFDKDPSGFLMKLSFNENNLYTIFKYLEIKESNCYPISRIDHQTGLIEVLRYTLAHDLPEQAPIKKMPAVQLHTRIFGQSQPDQITSYEYSSTNYLGFGSGQIWQEGKDNLFNTRVNYKYRSVENINEKNKIIRTYNKFHLLERESYYDNEVLYLKIDYVYYANVNLVIEEQVPQYSLLKRQDTTYYYKGNSRITTLTWAYDDYANLITEVKSDGSRVERVYYSEKGEGRNCPRHPYNMISYIKTETIHPPLCDQQYPPILSEFRYKSLPRFKNIYGFYVVLIYQKELGVIHEFTYYAKVYTHPDRLGKLIEDKKTINGFITITKYTFAAFASENFCRNIITTTMHDGLVITTTEEINADFFKVTKSIDATLIITNYQYDEFGRQVSETKFVDTPCEFSITNIFSEGSESNYIIETDRLKNSKKTICNNGGKVISTLIKSADDTEYYKANEMIYDNFGCMIEQTVFDSYASQSVSVMTKFKYDVYGNKTEITHSDGRVEKIVQDPVELTVSNIQVGLVSVVSRLDNTGREISKSTYDNSGTLLAKSTNTYDGYNNVIKIIDTNGHLTLMTYDKYNRILSSSRTIDFQIVTESYQYPDFSETSKPNKIMLNNLIVSTKEYDGLNRVKEETLVNLINMTTKYTYIGSFPLPNTITDQKNNVLELTYHPQYHYPILKLMKTEAELSIQRRYSDMTGALEETKNENADNRLTYNANGCLKKINFDIKRNSPTVKKEASFLYSKMGSLYQEIDFFGIRKVYSFDEHNRPKKVQYFYRSDKSLSVSLSYDEFSRVTSYSMSTPIGQIDLTLILNDLGAEIQRDFTLDSNKKLTIVQKYNSAQLLKERHLKDHTSSAGVAIEKFIYDDFSRLINYECAGDYCPVDRVKIPIKYQAFKHDIYGNIRLVDTTYNTGMMLNEPLEYNTQTFTYSKSSPFVLAVSENTHEKLPKYVAYKYDHLGNMLNDDEGRNYLHNDFNQLSFVTIGPENTYLTNYHYCGDSNLIAQLCPTSPPSRNYSYNYSYYINNVLSNELFQGNSTSYFRVAPGFMVRYTKNEIDTSFQYLFGNAQGSMLQILTTDSNNGYIFDRANYTPYGESTLRRDLG